MKDLNILDCSALFVDVRAGRWLFFMLTINIAGGVMIRFYWVVDFVYPTYGSFLTKGPSSEDNLREVI